MSEPPLNAGTDPASSRVYALIFNGLTHGLAAVDRFVALSEREAVTRAIYDALRTGGVEVRLTDGLEHLRQVAVDQPKED